MIKSFTTYLKESWSELAKVTWPSRQQSIKLTGLVIVFSIVIAAFIGAVDWVFVEVIQRFILKV